MTLQYYIAEHLFDGDGNVYHDYAVGIDEEGVLHYFGSVENIPSTAQVEYLSGGLCPGFINTHCHLELSHLLGRMPTGTGLIDFLMKIVSLRETDPETIHHRIEQEDVKMWEAGIVAVGDISNTAHTAKTKQHSPILYHTFLEVFDFAQDQLSTDFFEKSMSMLAQMPTPCTLVPHATYSVSQNLMALLGSASIGQLISIHNQESIQTDLLHKRGSQGSSFARFLEHFGFSYPDYFGGLSSNIDYITAHLPSNLRILLVHNTYTHKEDIAKATNHFDQVYLVTCPNANLFIENTLPDYDIFLEAGATVCIGTDSLTSNWHLSILEEMKTLKKYKSYLPTHLLTQWACANGARALQVEEQLGSLKIGTRPGLNHLFPLSSQGELTPETTVNKIA